MVPSLIKKYYDNKIKTLSFLVAFLFYNYNFGQINTPEDCINAYRICNANQNYFFEVNGPGAIDDANGALGLYCLSQADLNQWEINSVWFTFTPQYSGEFGFIICPENPTDEWNFALFHNNPVCNNLSNTNYWLACNPQPPYLPADGCTGLGFKNGFFGGGLMV